MIKKVFSFPSCSATAGRPFDGSPKCPLYNKTHNHLKSEGWEQMFYNTSKTGLGDLCNTNYRRLDEKEGVLDMLEVNIEGTKKTCTLTAVLSTYKPKNILQTIDHASEKPIMDSLVVFFKDRCGAIDR